MRLAAPSELAAPDVALTASVGEAISDLQFTSRYRVPFQFSRFVRRHSRAAPSPSPRPA